MTDLLKFQFYLYDSIVNQGKDRGFVKTLTLAVDGDTGETRIAFRPKDSSSDYINTSLIDEDGNRIENPTIDDLLLSNTKAYIRAHEMLSEYQADYNEAIHANGKPKLRIDHLTKVIGYYFEWFKKNDFPLPELIEDQKLKLDYQMVRIDGADVLLNKRQTYALKVLQYAPASLTSSMLLERVDGMMNTVTSNIRVSEIFKSNRAVFQRCIKRENNRYSLKDDF
jgi:hypothetical protein